MMVHSRNRLWNGAALVLLAIALLLLGAGTSARAAVKWLAPGEQMSLEPEAPFVVPEEKQLQKDQKPQLEKVRIAVVGGDDRQLAGLVAGEAPFETVDPTANPDLVVGSGRALTMARASRPLGFTLPGCRIVHPLARV